jgi:hypothetical protein
MRGALLLVLLALGGPVLANDDEDTFVLDRTIVLNAKDKSRGESLKAAFAQAGAKLEFDHQALIKSGFDLNEKVTRDFGESSLRDVMLALCDYPRNEGVHVVADGNGWILTSSALQKERRDQFLPDWLRSARYASPRIDHRGEVNELLIHGPVEPEIHFRLHELPSLRKLTISSSVGIDLVQLRQLSKAASLQELEVHGEPFKGVPIGDAVIEAIAELPSLHSLRLSETGATDKGIERLTKFPALRELFIYQENFLTDSSLKAIGLLQQLKTLSLITYVRNGKQGVAAFSPEGYRALSGMSNLESLTLIHSFHPPVVTDLKLPRLKSLSLSGISANDQAAAQLTTMPTLRRLNFERDVFTDEAIRHFATWPALRSLSFGSDRVTPAGFAALRELPHLEQLSFGLRPSDDILRHVAEISSLRGLSLVEMPSAQGIHILSKLQQLNSLKLHGSVDEMAFRRLPELKSLNSLSLQLTGLTQDRLDRLRKDLPNVRIVPSQPPILGGGLITVQPLR